MLYLLLCGASLYVSENPETDNDTSGAGPDPDDLKDLPPHPMLAAEAILPDFLKPDGYKLHHDFLDSMDEEEVDILFLEIYEMSAFDDIGTLVEERLVITENLGREMPNPALLRPRTKPTKFGINPETGFPDRHFPGLPAETGDMFFLRIANSGEDNAFFPRPVEIGFLEEILGHSLREGGQGAQA